MMKNKNNVKRFLSGGCIFSMLILPMQVFAVVPTQYSTSLNQVLLSNNEFSQQISEEEMNIRVKEMGEKLTKQFQQSKLRGATDNRWELVSTTSLTNVETVATNYIKTLATNYSETVSSNFNISAGTKIKGIPITVGFSSSKSSTMSGPSYSDKVANSSTSATHSFITSAQQAKIVRYNWKVVDAMGHILGYEESTVLVDGGTYIYNQKANIGNPTVIVENSGRNRTKTFNSVNDFRSSFGLNKTSGLFF